MLFVLGAAIMAIMFQLAAAQPTTDASSSDIATNKYVDAPTSSGSWASFCNDDDCNEGCGEWVDITNTGCLAESYRRSIKFKSNDGPEVRGGLVYSPADTCNCQTECDEFSFGVSGQGCMALNNSISYETFSYRLIGNELVFPCDTSVNNC